VKAQRIARLLRTGEVYSGRSVLLLPMSRATFDAVVAPRYLYRKVWAVKSAQWSRGALELLVKVFPGERGEHGRDSQDSATARALAAQLRAIRRAGVSLRGLRVKPYRHRESKAGLRRLR
jgi:hypothetical protein